MNILVTGGTGFIGEALIPALLQRGHDVSVLTRQSAPKQLPGVEYVQTLPSLSSTIDAVINLAGASLAGKRWTAAYKQEMIASRVDLTRALGEYFQSTTNPPSIWLNASAIGFYGPQKNEELTESSPPGKGFAAGLCREWELAATEAAGGARLSLLRLGVVLDTGGGAYPQMAQPFRMGVANWIGDGQQWLSWVHRDDVVSAFCFALQSPDLSGVINVTAPEAVTSRQFCQAMRQVHRTLLAIPMPGFLMRAMVGEMADELLITGQKVLPARLSSAGFEFSYPRLDLALERIESTSS
ncbi:TIGR01777 family oxidoreductase [Congregibacter variabilis]|uniref:TIGR01777 family oxidoreductase n=1 Tax=Congregibacter variabilis TaxID=3081200 RepID=A0ABZ0I4R6_9GAMM|nr:TIGR01777 family oxidoreductase [Congregibacter sp. IMCC43200]